MESLGSYLKQARERLNLSMKDVYNLSGITDKRLSNIENDKYEEPSPSLLRQLADIYRINIVDLYIRAGYLSDGDIRFFPPGLKNTHLLTSNDIERLQNNIDVMIMKGRRFRLGELFCGPGGIAWGAINAKVDDPNYCIVHQWSNDYDKDTCNTYRKNICPESPETVYHEDIRKLDMSKLAPIDALAFGFPCNDYSVVGEQKGMDGIYGPLYSYGVKALNTFNPQWFLAENVGGLRNANDGKAFVKILEELKKAGDYGYKLVPHLYKFEEYGIPQARHRIIIVGIRNDIDITYRVPSPATYSGIDNTCKTAIEKPPIPANAKNNEKTSQSEVVIKRLQFIKPGENAFTAKLPPELQLNVKGAKISQIYKRLDPNKPAYTVTGSGGGGTHIYHWEEPRALTNRERARLQTFPDSYEFIGSKESVRKQIGMAVPCRGAKIIFEAILKSFAHISYDYIESNIDE